MPSFVKLPRNGSYESHTGLSRSRLNQLILPSPKNDYRAVVRSVSLRAHGQRRGTRLVDFNSLMEYLHERNGFAEKEPLGRAQE